MINQQTQNILNKYGVNNPVVQKELEQPTKHEITINNETKNINEGVPANIGGPIQGRPIQFTNDVGKLKVWLSGKYAQQRELSRKRDEKYRRNELSLVRSTNKLMKKIEDANIRLGKNINPEKFGSKIGSQLRIMFLMLGVGRVIKSWPKIMEHLNGIGENSISIGKLFSKEGRQELKNTLRTKIVKSLGGKEGETVGEAFKKFFINTDENPGLFDLIKKKINNWIDIRADALGKVRKEHEEVSHPVGNKILNKLGKHINRFSSFLGDFFSVFLSGDKAFGKIMSNKIRDNAQDATDFNPSNYSRDIKDIANSDHGIDIEKVKAITKIDNDEEAADKVQQGSSYLFTPYNYFADNKQWYRFVNNSSHFDVNKLTRNGGGKELIRKPEASIAQCDEICFHLRCCAEGKNIDAGSYYKFSYKNSISAIAYGISRLYHLSKDQGTIPVTCDFLYDILGDISKINVKSQRYVLKLVPLKNNDIYDSKNDSKDATYNKRLNLTDTAETYTYILVKTDDETDVGDGTKAIYFFEVDPENLLKAINIFTESNLVDKDITTENSKYNIAILTAVGKRCKKKEDFEKAKDEIVSVFKISDEAHEYGKQLEAEYQNYASQSRLEDLQNNWKEDYSKLEGSLEKAKESAVNKINATAGDLKEFVDINITPNSSKNNSTNEVEITEPIVNVADVKQRIEQSNIIKEGEEIINTIQNEINDLSKTKNDLQNEINDLSKTKDEIAVDESIPSQQPKQQQTAGNGKSYSSNNIPPYKGFNVAKAIDTLNKNTGKYLGNVKDSKTGKIIHKAGDQKDEYVSGHWCGKAVENALNAGGIQGSFGDAYMFVNTLPKHNFIQIPANSALLPGDIIVEMRTRKHPKGHVAMYNGQQWVSDYKQGNIWFRGLKGMTGEITLWRYNLTDTERESPASNNNNNNNTSPNNTPNKDNNNSTPSSPYLNTAAKSKEYSGLFDKKLNDSEKKKNWVKVLYEATKEKLKNKGFDERFTDILLSQWAFESNWGMNEAGAFNLGGIKASCNKVKGKKTPKDPSHAVLLNTTEYLNDSNNSKYGFPEVISVGYDNKRKKYKWKIKDYFKVFDSLGDFIDSKLKLVGETHKSLDVDPTISNYVNSIKSWGYFTGDENSYINGLTNRYNSIQKVKSENPNLSTAEYSYNNTNKDEKYNTNTVDNNDVDNDIDTVEPENTNNIVSNGEFNTDKAINWIHENQSKVLYETKKALSLGLHKGDRKKINQSIGACAGYVRRAINAGGIKTPNNPISAYQYNDYLPKIGFIQVENNESKLKKGDISIESATHSHKHGHIAIWDGTRWNSDFLQNNRKVHKSDSGNFTLWRYGKLITEKDISKNTTNNQLNFSSNEISTTNLGSDYIDVGIYFNLDKEVCRNIDIFAKRNPEEAKRLMDYINKDKSNVSKVLKENNGFFSKEYFAKLSNIFNLKKLDNITYEKELGGIIDKEKYTPIKINKIIPTNTRNTKFNINLDNSTEAINNFSKIPTKLSLLNSILGITMKNIGDNIGATDNIGVSYVNSNPIIPNIPKSENLIK